MIKKSTLAPLFILLATWSTNLLPAAAEKPPVALVTLTYPSTGFRKQTTSLIAALYNKEKNTEKLKLMIAQAQAENSINYVDPQGTTALTEAVLKENIFAIEQLLQAGAHVHADDPKTACAFGNAITLSDGKWNEVLELLIQHTPDTCFTDDLQKTGFSPLQIAAKQKNTELFEQLLTRRTFTIQDFQAKGSLGSVQEIIVRSRNSELGQIYNAYLEKIKGKNEKTHV